MYQHLEAYAGDPILSLVQTYLDDPREHKVNLGIGIYLDEAGVMPLPDQVAAALAQVGTGAQGYLPMEGDAALRRGAAALLLGEGHELLAHNRVAVVQTLGGSGALKLGADLLHRWFPQAAAYVSDPTWDNHKGIFAGAGCTVGTYPYYDAVTGGVLFEQMHAFIDKLPENSILLLHPCCHNPTGADLSPAQWDELLHTIRRRNLIAFMDMAYQGFGADFDSDAYPIRRAAELGVALLVSLSFSKNMSLYGQRTGALLVSAPDAAQAELVLGQLKMGVRRIYSSPPAVGGLAAAKVLTDPAARAAWQTEVYAMRDRIRTMRQALYDVLAERLPERDCSFLLKQRGMFSYTGLSPAQVDRLREESAIYLLQSGRICLAGLNTRNVERVADALVRVYSA